MMGNRFSLSFVFVLILFFLSFPYSGQAANGFKPLGPGPLEIGYGGTGVALIQSAQTVFINPAGMGLFENEIAASLTLPIQSAGVDTSAAALGNPDAADLSSDEVGYLPNIGLIFKLSDNLRFGFSIATGAFTQISIGASRYNSSFTNNEYDRNFFFGNYKFMPAVGIKLTPDFYLGAGLELNYSALKSDSATNAPGFPETAGDNEIEDAFGIGARIGLWYRLMPKLDVGVVYVFRSRLQKFGAYEDYLATAIDLPRELAVGVAYRPFKGFNYTLDFRWINYSLGILGRDPLEGGFGWQDQYVVATGLGYDFWPKFKVPVHVAMGYNYARSPFKPGNVFPNLLLPVSPEHHFNVALAFRVRRYLNVDLSYTREFSKTLVDNGTLDPGFAGAVSRVSGDVLSFGLRGRWGEKKPAP